MALPDFVSKLNYLNLHAPETGAHLYLIIDEYDNFTNIILNEKGNDVYHALTCQRVLSRDFQEI